MKKLYAVLFKSENPVIAACFMALISVAIPVFIHFAAMAQWKASWYESSLTVESSYKLLYLQERKIWLMILGPAISVAVSIFYVWYNGGLGKGAGDKTPGRFYALCWIGTTALCLWGLSGAYGNYEYTEIVTEPVFNYLKGNHAAIDSMFIK